MSDKSQLPYWIINKETKKNQSHDEAKTGADKIHTVGELEDKEIIHVEVKSRVKVEVKQRCQIMSKVVMVVTLVHCLTQQLR